MNVASHQDKASEFDGPWLLSPMEYESFVQTHWSQSSFRVSRNNPSYYDRLLSECDLEFALHAACKVSNAVDELMGDEQSQHCRSQSRAVAVLKEGKSLRINSLQNFSRPITILCRNLEQLLSCPVNVNLYLTPGAGKALLRHFDTHDVFVLQIHGEKRWRLFDTPAVLPLEYLPQMRGESNRDMKMFRLGKHAAAKPTGEPTDDFVLKAGDFLYVPRGCWHEAEGVAGIVSCHLTVGIQPVTYTDLLSLALGQIAKKDSRLRQPLPLGFATHSDQSDVVCAQVAEILQILPGTLDARLALAELGGIFRRNRKASLENSLFRAFDEPQTTEVMLESAVHMREGLVCGVNSAVSPAQIAFGAKMFSIAPAYEEACRFVTRNRRFTVSDLPDNLSSSEKLSLAQQLIAEGFLQVSHDRLPERENAADQSGWLPTRVDLEESRVQWIDFGSEPFQEPFFQQTIRRRTSMDPRPKSKSTGLDYAAALTEDLPPSGFIFHISRCGSTLAANGLRAIPGTIVISEPQPISALLHMPKTKEGSLESNASTGRSEEFIRGIVRAYGQRRSRDEKALVFKLSSWNILRMVIFRKLWPHVPCVVVIRNPLEVAVSCLEQLPGWMRWRQQPRTAASLLGWEAESISEMTDISFCARVLGEFFRSAYANFGSSCRIVEYETLTADTVEDIARFFGIATTPATHAQIQASLFVYSKDASRQRPFTDDRQIKQTKASDPLRQEIQRWTQDAYERLRLTLPARHALARPSFTSAG